MRDIIRDFDINLTIKANKSTVQEMLVEQSQNFIVKNDLTRINDKFDELLEQIKENGQELNDNMERMRD